MTRLARMAALSAVLGFLFAAVPAVAQDFDTEEEAGEHHAKRVLVRKARKVGIDYRVSDVRANCKRRNSFWFCRAKANTTEGVCNAEMRLYNVAGPFWARNVAVGCAPPAVTPDE